MKRIPPHLKYEPYEHCPFCNGKGCFGCKERRVSDEAAKRKTEQAELDLKAQCIFTGHYDNPEEMQTLQEVFHSTKLAQFFDASDITDEDVIRHLGGGKLEDGQTALAMIVGYNAVIMPHVGRDASEHRRATAHPNEFLRAQVIAGAREQMAHARGMERIKEALRGKPGAE